MSDPQTPKELDAIVDAVLAYKPRSTTPKKLSGESKSKKKPKELAKKAKPAKATLTNQ